MMSKMKCFGLFAGCALATGALYATATTNTFESSTAEGWVNGSVTQSNFTYSVVAGLPASASLPAENHVLLVEGSVSNTLASALENKPMVDMMVQTARPDDELGFPSSESTNDIQIAVAVDSNGCFNAYCKNKSGVIGWYKLSNTQYDAAGWARVSFLFDYTASPKRCQIRIDGQPVMSEFGYLTVSTTDGTQNGAWYTLANDRSSVASMKVIGCTAIDEVVMDSTSTTYPIATAIQTETGVPYSWYDQYGISWDGTGVYDASGMTAAQKFNACLSPFDGQKFEIKSVGVKTVRENDVDVKKVTVTVPVPETRADRQIVVDYSTDKTFATKESVVVGNTGTVEITAPVSGAVFYRLRATDVQAQ